MQSKSKTLRESFIGPREREREREISGCLTVCCSRLEGNKLVTVHLPSLATHPALQVPAKFYLGANPLLCDCHMDYLARMWELTQTGENATTIVLAGLVFAQGIIYFHIISILIADI